MDLSAFAVFVAGTLTFLSPCVLPLIPIYLSILSGGESTDAGRFRGVLASIAFAAGFSLVFSLLGLSATVVGRALIEHRVLFQQVGGIVVLLLGLRFVGWLKFPGMDGGSAGAGRFKTRFHYLNAFVLGLLFAFAWSPCVGSVLGAVLTYTSLRTSDPLAGMGYLSLYSLGFALPLIVVAAVAGPALAMLRRARRFIPVFEKATGALLVVTGFLLATDRLGLLDYAMAQPPLQAVEAAGEAPEAAVPPSSSLPGSTSPGLRVTPAQPAEGDSCGGETATAGTQCGMEAEEPLPILYEFHSPRCPVCLQMIPAINALKNECVGRQVEIRQVDVTSPEGRPLARRFGITGIPVFVFTDKDQQEIARLVGYQTLESLSQATSILIGEECPAYRRVQGL